MFNQHTGDLGNIEADDNGRVSFRIINDLLQVGDIIGRALVVTEKMDDLGKGDTPASKINGNSGKRYVIDVTGYSRFIKNLKI
jgi:copper chaperone for superoxide dismutase